MNAPRISPTVPLGEVSEAVMGQAPPGAHCNKDGIGTIFVKAGEFSELQPLIREWTTKPLKVAKKGDVLVCVVGATAGKVNLGIDCAIGRSVAAVRPHPTRLDTGYLHYFLRTRTARLRAASQGLAQGVITRDMLGSLEIPLPPLDEQRRIAAVLDKADALRRKRKRAIELASGFAHSLFHEMFGDRNWDEMPFGDAVDEFRYGTSQKSGDSGYPVLRIPNVVGGKIDIRHLKTVPLDSGEFKRLQMKDGDLLLVRTNGNRDYVGRCAIFEDSIGRVSHFPSSSFVYASYLIRARLRAERFAPHFVQAFLSSTDGRKAMLERAKTSAGQFNINTDGLSSILLPAPPMHLQQEFSRRRSALVMQSAPLRQSSEIMDHLFSSLQHRAFSGQL